MVFLHLNFQNLGFVIVFSPLFSLFRLSFVHSLRVDFLSYPKCKQHEQTTSKLKWKYSVWSKPIVYLETNQFFPFIFGFILCFLFFFPLPKTATTQTTMCDALVLVYYAISMIRIENEREQQKMILWYDKNNGIECVRKCVCWSIFQGAQLNWAMSTSASIRPCWAIRLEN